MTSATPRFSIVSAIGNSEQYLDEFINSLAAQTKFAAEIELIAVTAGCPDTVVGRLRDRSMSSPISITVVEDAVVDQATSLNAGIPLAAGEWITFASPQDLLAPDYFEQFTAFLANNPDIDLAMAQVVVRDELKQRDTRNSRSFMFDQGNRIVDLNQEAATFPYSAHTTLFRREKFIERGLKFDPELRPSFADVRITAEFVLFGGDTKIGCVAAAKYLQRTPLGAAAVRHELISEPAYFQIVPQLGLLHLLKTAKSTAGRTPVWVGNLVLAELDWYFRSEELLNQDTAAVGQVAADFLATVVEISDYLDPTQLENYQPHRSIGPWPEFLLYGLKGKSWHLPYVIEASRDLDRDAIKLTYNFSGPLPRESFILAGQQVEPLASKIRSYRYFEKDVHYQRILWLATETGFSFTSNSAPTEHRKHYQGPTGTLNPRTGSQRNLTAIRPQNYRGRVEKIKIKLSARTRYVKEFGDAWLICDRLHNASDSGEVMFKYLRKNRPDINAWFILTEGTPDFGRLVSEGFGDRLLTPGSLKWHAAMRHAQYLISSHSAKAIVNPPDIAGSYQPSFKQVFLQHGVISRDMSNWLNNRNLSIFVTSTPAEQESIAGDFTPYKYTSREAKMTGLPRYDEHLRVDQLTPENQKNVVLIAPTWRYWLTFPHDKTGKKSRQIRSNFLDSEFAINWMAVLKSSEIADAAAAHGFTVGFLPHPNLRSAESLLELPQNVQLFSFLQQTPQQIFAQTRLLVTDYSAVAFDLAYLNRPAIYFQFDIDRINAGGHNGRPGYFSYERMGFGPVAYNAVDAIDQIVSTIEHNCKIDQKYHDRIQAAFPNRDGHCTKRAVAEIERLS